MSVATSLVLKTIAKHAMPALTEAFGGDKHQASEVLKKIILELDGKRLDGMFAMADRELTGTQEQREWRPKWMNTIRHMLTAYFALTFSMGVAMFVGLAFSGEWVTSSDMGDLIGAWAELGAMLLTLTSASFAIYGIGRTVEKVTNSEGGSMESAIGILKKIPAGLKERRQKVDPEPPMVYRQSGGARVQVTPNAQRTQVDPQPTINQADIELDVFEAVDNNPEWDADATQSGRRIPADWKKTE